MTRSLLLAALVAALCPLRTHAGFTTYTTQAGFQAAAGAISTEDYSEFQVATNLPNPVVLDGVTYYAPGSTVLSIFSLPLDSRTLAFGQPDVYLSFGGGSVETFGFAIVLPDSHVPQYSPSHFHFAVTEASGITSTVDVALIPGSVFYFGFVETAGSPGIVQVRIRADEEFTLMGSLSHGAITPGDFPVFAIPEPASAAMLGLGLVGVGLGWRRAIVH